MTTTALSEVKPPRDGLLYDSQWVNIVNHDNAYCGWDVEEAVNHAVKATLAAVKSNIESALASAEPVAFDFAAHLARQAAWSARTFGPGSRAAGVVDHIRKELTEIEADPGDLKEWIDVVILALDGAWRSGATPAEIVAALAAKQEKNEGRSWPDWRTADPSKAIEHDRSKDTHAQPAAKVEAPRRVFPPVAFEEWFADIWSGTDGIPVPPYHGDGWDAYIEKRQLALGAWVAATESAPAPASVPDGPIKVAATVKLYAGDVFMAEVSDPGLFSAVMTTILRQHLAYLSGPIPTNQEGAAP